MAIDTEYTRADSVAAGRCPIDHRAFSQQKTARAAEPDAQPIARGADGTWHVRDYDIAKAILRGAGTKQAGFKAELIEQTPGAMKRPILYQEGKQHLQQRKQTAPFFTPRATSENYRQLMETLSDRIIADLKRSGRADLSALSMELAVRVAGKVVGLTNSRAPGMDRRLNAFFSNDIARPGWRPREVWNFLKAQTRVAAFFYLDVQPAIKARRRRPQQDVISHLLSQSYGSAEILTECVTYAAAGMVTTREFICVAAWHLLEQAELRQRFVSGAEEERHALLHEILRLEPIVGHLYRRATADISVEHAGAPITIPAGDLIDLQIYAINADTAVVGDDPLAICPGRTLHADRAAPAVMGFGDGHHRCPGAYVAIQESDIFLQRLLAVEGLRVERWPTLGWNDLVTGYELRDFMVAIP